ncbi:hypothetical protein L6164_033541 [Bauhinia variegata]|uniref:Uncharacterized protein n=1 Tax=Bauhinia variegata TaxID=167791 RepID=A0ACB9KRZ0_BAUVA|nr:hypothetical protein L6164_033541 [Bauhinia variegata]
MYKKRLVAKGFHQRPGWDYSTMFSPVVKLVTMRLVLALVVSSSWCIRQLDINNAFLQGTLHEDVYMAQLPGFVSKEHPTHVCKLKKAIYGLKQAPRAWYTELRTFLIHIGFVNSIADASLFIFKSGLDVIYLLVYVDDIIITGSPQQQVLQVIQQLTTRFSLKDLGNLSYFLGVEVDPHPQGLFLSQRKYILDILSRAQMAESNTVSTPMCATTTLTKYSGEGLVSPTKYRTLIGSLQYLSFTQPDVAFTVNRLSQFMHAPIIAHWNAIKRLLKYLAGTMHHGIVVHKSSPFILHGYSDANWAGDKDDYASPITWHSREPSRATQFIMGLITSSMNLTKATPDMKTHMDSRGLLCPLPAKATAKVSKIHATTSLKGADAMAVSPTWVVKSLSSARMRAKTGKAVMEKKTPMKMC